MALIIMKQRRVAAERECMWGGGGLKERKTLGSNYYLSLRGKYIESCQSAEGATEEL